MQILNLTGFSETKVTHRVKGWARSNRHCGCG